MKRTSFHWRMYHTLREVYKRPTYIAINIVSIIVYYYLFVYLIKIQQQGLFFATIPDYLIYLLVITSSIALTIGLYSIKNTINNGAKELSTGIGTATALAGGVVGGCGCAAPLVLGLSVFGLNTTQTFALIDFISANQLILFSLMIAINFFVVIYYLNKLSEPSCEIRRKGR
ncbi:MAG: hypothetical protein ACHQX1_00860 [Candidatus Micrarchaeales archaeon]